MSLKPIVQHPVTSKYFEVDKGSSMKDTLYKVDLAMAIFDIDFDYELRRIFGENVKDKRKKYNIFQEYQVQEML